jgi:uncharacterized RDD family membrane protein YckC
MGLWIINSSISKGGTLMENTTQNTAEKADIGKRFAAVVIDSIIASIAVRVFGYVPFIGPLLGSVVGAAYMLGRDGLSYEFMDHRSIGKKLMKLRPIKVDGGTMDLETSLKRNWMFGFGPLAMIAMFIPIIGWFILLPLIAIASLVLAILESVFVLKDPEGRRWGDMLADTKVIEVEE